MSFSSDTKNEISRDNKLKACCNIAEIAGIIKSSGSIILAGKGEVGILVSTENPAVARHVKTLFSEQFHVDSSIKILKPEFRHNKHVYEISVTDPTGAKRILFATGIMSKEDGLNVINDNFSDSIMKKKCCRKACLKGLFLGAGSISNPEKDYSFEIRFAKETVANAARRLINSFEDIHAKKKERRGSYVVYIKDSEQIKDILNIVGAHTQLLQYENVRVIKSMRNKTNRINNFDNANYDRTTSAADKQVQDITQIANTVGLDELSQKLLDIALARLNHPDASLNELGEMMSPKIKKSAVQARMKAIANFAINIEHK